MHKGCFSIESQGVGLLKTRVGMVKGRCRQREVSHSFGTDGECVFVRKVIRIDRLE